MQPKLEAVSHTPGPWVSVPRNRSCLASVPDDAWAIMHQRKNSDDPCDIGIIEGHENNEANARLIASSPELLAALERIRDGSEPCECDHTTKDCCNNVDYCCTFCISDAAIRKAKEGK